MMTAPVYSFSVPNGDKTITELLKLCGRTPFSVVVREALEDYYVKISKESVIPDCLPKWKRFRKNCETATGEQLFTIGRQLKQLQTHYDEVIRRRIK